MVHWRRGQSYGQDLRERVLAAREHGDSIRAVAKQFDVSPSYVSKVAVRCRETGERTARPQCNHVPPKLSAHEEALSRHVAENADATLDELRQWLRETHGTSVSIRALWKTLRRLGLSLKKSRSGRPSSSGRTSSPPA